MTEPSQVGNDSLERLRHRFRIREIVIDKGALALVLGILAFLANSRLATYKSSLDARLEAYKSTLQMQLDDLRTFREKRRVLAEREVTAHENVWKALIDLRHFLAPLLGKPLDPPTERALTTQVFKFTQVVEAESIYLSEPLRRRLDHLVDPTLADFTVNWQSSPRSTMTNQLWEGLSKELESIGADVRSAIYDKRKVPNTDRP